MIRCFVSFLFAVILLAAFPYKSLAQIKYPNDYFRPPLDIPLYLAGNFGELRNNHFHSGIDIKTNGVEGLNVYAVAEGYVSRIKVSSTGYGNALYITHPNGYLSLYGHLQCYMGEVANYVKKKQYEKQAFDVDLYLQPNELPLKKGDIVALSGNSGASGGAHLHFEIRDALTEEIINPLFFGFDIKDDISPIFKSVSIYPLDKTSFVNFQSSYKSFTTYGGAGKYNLGKTPLITVYGNIGIALDAYDLLNSQTNHCGIYSVELYVDSQLVYFHELEKFAFDKTRCLNSHIDYERYIKTKARIQKCFIEDNNQLGIYKSALNSGKCNVSDNKLHYIKIVAKDIHGNSSQLNFKVQSKYIAMASLKKDESLKYVASFPYGKENSYETNDFKINIPSHLLYDTLQFEYFASDILNGCLSPLHHVHTIFTPVHSYFSIAIKADIPTNYQSKAVLCLVNDDGYFKSIGGSYADGWLSAQTREFGNYTIRIDSVPPKINPINIVNNKTLGGQTTIKASITDNLSGIKSYHAYIDDKWELMAFDQKYNLLTLQLDPALLKGKHTFKLVVTDERGNSKEYVATFIK